MDKELHEWLADSGVPADKIQKVVDIINGNDTEKAPEKVDNTTELELKAALDRETDWRKRAQISARLISWNFDNDKY